MLDLLVYAAIFAIGTVLGIYVRRTGINDFKAGLTFGLTEATTIAQKLQQPRHSNHQPRKDQKNN